MDCRTFNSRLEDYLEDGLDFPGRFAMERHAQQCFRCGKTVSDAQELRRLARQFYRVTAPPDFETVLMKRIQTEHIRPGRWFWGFRWPVWKLATAGTLSVAAILAAVLFLRVAPERQETAATANPVATAPEGPAPGSATPIAVRLSETAERLQPAPAPVASAASDYPLERVDAPEYIEVLVPGPGDRMRVVRLPKTIRMRYGQPSQQYFIRNVSH
jgi:hypothetical protein